MPVVRTATGIVQICCLADLDAIALRHHVRLSAAALFLGSGLSFDEKRTRNARPIQVTEMLG